MMCVYVYIILSKHKANAIKSDSIVIFQNVIQMEIFSEHHQDRTLKEYIESFVR